MVSSFIPRSDTIQRMKRFFTIFLLLLLFAWMIAGLGPANASPDVRVEPDVWAQIDAQGRADVIIQLNQADLGPAYALSAKSARGQWVYATLRQEALRSQAPLLAELKREGASYQRFWVVNAIRVQVDEALLMRLLRYPQVQRVASNDAFLGVEPRPDEPLSSQSIQGGLPWGVGRVDAPWAWEQGITGEGVVVAGQDTGYDWTHQALKRVYRGYDPVTDTASHDYNWHDAIHELDPHHTNPNPCGLDSPEPCDDYGHGTHTMGIMAGNDLPSDVAGWPRMAEHPIGLAPGAKWIGCRNMEGGWGRPATYLECFQWFIAPWPLDGDPFADGDPAKAPDVINNSWSCPEEEGCTPDRLAVIEPALNAADAAGILVVASATNNGSVCGSIKEPIAIYPRAFTVGATTDTDTLALFSSRGPISYNGITRIGPDVSAPGVNIYSSLPGDRYRAMSGTSMSGPHVAAAAALLMSAEPSLRGETDMVRAILSRTADPRTSDQGCGGDAPDAVPNNGFGWGIVNIRSAIESLTQEATIAGVVRDAEGAIIQGEPIPIGVYRYPSGELVASGMTSLSGHYSVSVPWGAYIVTRMGGGGASVAGPVYAVGGHESQADIVLFSYRSLFPFIAK